MSKERSSPSLWRLHQKNLNPCQGGGTFEEIFNRQQKNNNNNKAFQEMDKITLDDWLAVLEKAKE
jgi:hypothetical protein